MSSTTTRPPAARERRLLAPAGRTPAIVVVALSAAVLAVMAFAFRGDRLGTSADYAIMRWSDAHIGPSAATFLLDLTEPVLTTTLTVIAVVVAVGLRQWRVAIWAAAGPLLAILLTEVVLKPAIGRRLNFPDHRLYFGLNQLAFPSGHETGLAALTAEATVLVLMAQMNRVARSAAIAVLAAWTVGGALGLVRSSYHYPTDTLGALAVAVICVVGTALAVDGVRRAPGDVRRLRSA